VIRPDILAAIEAEAIRAQARHGAASIHQPFLNDDARLGVMHDEVDEVWEAVVYDLPIDHPHGLRAELVQVAASAIGWLACLPLPTLPAGCCGFGCGEGCVCEDDTCAGTCGNPEHMGRGRE